MVKSRAPINLQKLYGARSRLYDDAYYRRMHAWSAKERYQEELRGLLQMMEVTKTDQVLDIGCSTGNVIKYLRAHYGCQATGLDYPKAWLAACRVTPVVRGDAKRLPFCSSQFDKVLMLHIIGHLPESRLALAEAHRVLRPGGSLGIITPNAWFVRCMKPLNTLGIIPHTPDPTVLTYFTRERLEQLLAESPFARHIIRARGEVPPLARWIERLSESAAERFRERLFCVAWKS